MPAERRCRHRFLEQMGRMEGLLEADETSLLPSREGEW